MLRSMPHYDRRIRRNRLASWWAAWSAVHGGVSLEVPGLVILVG